MPELYLGSSPHIGANNGVSRIMGHVLIALTPLAVFGIVLYGLHALAVILVCVAAAVGGEALFRLAIKQENRSRDLSAAVTGLLLALVLPPGAPLWIAALGGIFAVVAAKEFFGGIGANVFNPALSGRAFLLMSFPQALTTWAVPGRSLDALSGPTPLGIIKTAQAANPSLPFSQALEAVGKSFVDAGAASASGYGEILKTLFTGNRGGAIGESSIMLILAGCVYLLAFKIIDWRAPLAMIASAAALSFVLRMDPLFSVLSGSLFFSAVFMATDYTTAPVTAKGKLIFGAGAGIITILIRKWGNYPEGVTYGLLIMNAVTPFLNRLIQKKYGYVKAAKPVKAAGTLSGGAK